MLTRNRPFVGRADKPVPPLSTSSVPARVKVPDVLMLAELPPFTVRPVPVVASVILDTVPGAMAGLND